jgi:hypothetical protein
MTEKKTTPSDSNPVSLDKAANANSLQHAIERLENLSSDFVEKFESYDSLEAGCLSCSFTVAEDRRIKRPTK